MLNENQLEVVLPDNFPFCFPLKISKNLSYFEISKNYQNEKLGKNECNWTRTHNHFVHKQTLNHLAKLAKWLSCVVSTYLYGAFDCMFLSCHVRVSAWIHIL